MALKQRHQGNEMPTNDKITAAIYESDGKKFKMDSEFLLFKLSTATYDHSGIKQQRELPCYIHGHQIEVRQWR